MNGLWQVVLTVIGSTNVLLMLFLTYWIKKELHRHDRALERLNQTALIRFSRYHQCSVDAIKECYALFIDLHNSVFRYCFPDWDSDKATDGERKQAACDAMVRFYVHFRKHQIFMEDPVIEEFERGFRFLQRAFSKKEDIHIEPDHRIQIGITVYADMIKTFPTMLKNLRTEIQRTVAPEQCTSSGPALQDTLPPLPPNQ